MKIIQFAALFTLLSVSFPLAQASESSNTNKDVIQKQEDDAINPVLTTSSSSNFLRGAANLAWDLLVVSDGNGNEEDLTSCALWSSCPSDYPYCRDNSFCAASCTDPYTPQSCSTSTTESYDSVEKDMPSGNDEFISEERCQHECCDNKGCWCCGSAQKDIADAGEGTKASFEKASYAIV